MSPDHDHDHPLSHVGAIEAAYLALHRNLPPCPHCHDERRIVPMSGTAWGVETFHEPDCPSHEDNQPAAEWGGDDHAEG